MNFCIYALKFTAFPLFCICFHCCLSDQWCPLDNWISSILMVDLGAKISTALSYLDCDIVDLLLAKRFHFLMKVWVSVRHCLPAACINVMLVCYYLNHKWGPFLMSSSLWQLLLSMRPRNCANDFLSHCLILSFYNANHSLTICSILGSVG